MTISGNTVTVVLGTYSRATSARTTAGGSGTMAWTPTTRLKDFLGNSLATTPATESGAADIDS